MTGAEYASAWAFVAAFAGDPNVAVIDWRAIHDTNKEIPGHARRGTLPEWWNWLTEMNAQGYGVFATIAAMDGVGRELANVHYIRAHYVDLDNLSARQNYDAAAGSYPSPSFAVQSSPNKFHVYWAVAPFQGNDRFQLLQRKLRQVFDGDKRIIDATRVMRVPGTFHLKDPANPHLVTCWQLPGFGQWYPIETIEAAYAAVNVIDGGIGVRHDLGEPSLAAPSLDWLKHGLSLLDPNTLDRGDWIAITSAIKQAGWTLADPETLFNVWSDWCNRYGGVGADGKPYANDPGENLKQWNSIRNTELGWPSLLRRVPSLQAAISFGGVDRSGSVPGASPAPAVPPMGAQPATNGSGAPPMPAPPPLDCSGEYLTHLEQREWFKGCTFVINLGLMLTDDGRFLSPGQFNAAFGGKKFIIDTVGKMTNEAWQAATRSTLWTVPKVDHIRFLPHAGYHDIVVDDLGRKGINSYKPLHPRRVPGDASPFLRHVAAMLPDAGDQRILLDYLAHNVRYPGHKIPWAPVIQSTEGAGKGVLKRIMTHAMGRPYVYFPNAKELTNSGSQFNAWMRNKLFILADEIKVDDRRDLIEVLKPMISEETIEIQGKGQDQELEDNYSNWCFFTNYKDAIPVNKNGRRFAIFYSPLQTAKDLLDRGMDSNYFKWLYDWLAENGTAIVTDFLLNYPIERGAIPMRSPDTSSSGEAVVLSRSPIERVIIEAIEDQLPGFRHGWISTIAATNRIKASGAVARSVSPAVIGSVVEAMGYVSSGRAPRPYFQEDRETRSHLYHFAMVGDVNAYGRLQGWE
jgi:hypothetical protein